MRSDRRGPAVPGGCGRHRSLKPFRSQARIPRPSARMRILGAGAFMSMIGFHFLFLDEAANECRTVTPVEGIVMLKTTGRN